jgi:Protein of unknown function (DUF1573)
MKYLFVFLLSGVLLACSNSDSKVSASANRDSLNQAALSDSANYTSLQWIDSTFQDLGKVNQGQVVDITWHLKNTGTKPLVIANVTPGCGCTVAEKPVEPIAPGGESVIKAKFDSKNQSEGPHRKNVTVLANTKENTYYLTFQVDVTKK